MNSHSNLMTKNNFSDSGFAVTLVESSGNEINENVVNTTDEFLDLISSFQNHASLTRIGKSIYASEKLAGK